MSLLCITNGHVIDPATGRDGAADIWIDKASGQIIDAPAQPPVDAEMIDAAGKIVAPGFVDIHVHFREPGQTHKEDIGTGSRAAAAGGFTSVVCMPNTSPVADNAGTIQRIRDAVARKAVVRVYPTGCLTVGMAGESLAPIGSLKEAGIVAVTDDGKCVQNNEIMRRAVEYAHMFGLVVMDHCEDASMTAGAVMNEGYWSLRLGLKGWPSAAEDMMIARNVVLSRHTGAHIHMQHVTTAYGVDIIRRAKKRGIRVSGEASPHHLFFTDADCAEYNTHFKMNPPLRTEADRQALIEGILDGTLDVLATDHAPHTADEKDCEFDYAPFGIIGLETALPAYLEVLFHSGKCDLPFLIERMSLKPAQLLGLNAGTLASGAPADVVIFDPHEAHTIEAAQGQSRSRNCPWDGHTLRGRVLRTLIGGVTVWDGKQILGR